MGRMRTFQALGAAVLLGTGLFGACTLPWNGETSPPALRQQVTLRFEQSLDSRTILPDFTGFGLPDRLWVRFSTPGEPDVTVDQPWGDGTFSLELLAGVEYALSAEGRFGSDPTYTALVFGAWNGLTAASLSSQTFVLKPSQSPLTGQGQLNVTALYPEHVVLIPGETRIYLDAWPMADPAAPPFNALTPGAGSPLLDGFTDEPAQHQARLSLSSLDPGTYWLHIYFLDETGLTRYMQLHSLDPNLAADREAALTNLRTVEFPNWYHPLRSLAKVYSNLNAAKTFDRSASLTPPLAAPVFLEAVENGVTVVRDTPKAGDLNSTIGTAPTALLTLAWDYPGANETGFVVRRTRGAGEPDGEWTLPAGSRTWAETGPLLPSTTYVYAVSALNPLAQPAESAALVFQAITTVPDLAVYEGGPNPYGGPQASAPLDLTFLDGPYADSPFASPPTYTKGRNLAVFNQGYQAVNLGAITLSSPDGAGTWSLVSPPENITLAPGEGRWLEVVYGGFASGGLKSAELRIANDDPARSPTYYVNLQVQAQYTFDYFERWDLSPGWAPTQAMPPNQPEVTGQKARATLVVPSTVFFGPDRFDGFASPGQPPRLNALSFTELSSASGTSVLPGFNFAQDFTLSFWVGSLEFLPAQTLILASSFDMPMNPTRGFQLEIYDDSGTPRPRLRTPTNSHYSVLENAWELARQWNHLVITYTAAAPLLTLEINGRTVLSWAGQSLSASAGADLLTFGPYLGQLDDIRLYNRPLLALESQALWFEGVNPLTEPRWADLVSPAAPGGLQVPRISGSSLDLTWDLSNLPEADRWTVVLELLQGGTALMGTSVPYPAVQGQFTWAPPSLTVGQTYGLRLRVRDWNGNLSPGLELNNLTVLAAESLGGLGSLGEVPSGGWVGLEYSPDATTQFYMAGSGPEPWSFSKTSTMQAAVPLNLRLTDSDPPTITATRWYLDSNPVVLGPTLSIPVSTWQTWAVGSFHTLSWQYEVEGRWFSGSKMILVQE